MISYDWLPHLFGGDWWVDLCAWLAIAWLAIGLMIAVGHFFARPLARWSHAVLVTVNDSYTMLGIAWLPPPNVAMLVYKLRAMVEHEIDEQAVQKAQEITQGLGRRSSPSRAVERAFGKWVAEELRRTTRPVDRRRFVDRLAAVLRNERQRRNRRADSVDSTPDATTASGPPPQS